MSYYRSPRRLPDKDQERNEEDRGPRSRELIILLIILVVLVIFVFLVSYMFENLGLSHMALGLRLLSGLLLFVTVGTVFTVVISYFLLGTFLKREFRKRFQKIDEERQSMLRQMMGDPDAYEDETQPRKETR